MVYDVQRHVRIVCGKYGMGWYMGKGRKMHGRKKNHGSLMDGSKI